MLDVQTLLQFHYEGLERISAVVDGSPDYDSLLTHTLSPWEFQRFDVSVPLAQRRERATILSSEKIKRGPFRVFRPEFHQIACEGTSKNNIREFMFFERICNDYRIKISNKNYSFVKRSTMGELNSSHEESISSVCADVEKFYNTKNKISASIVHLQTMYSRTFLSFLFSFSHPDAVWPSALVVANDHSPVRVALCMIMKSAGIPRIYLQHAAVSNIFPPLDFEYSVLRNVVSLETYKSIGPVDGKVFILPREREPFRREILEKDRGDLIDVIIYPTSRVIPAELENLVEKLLSNKKVKSIGVKEHPGAAVPLSQVLQNRDVLLHASVPHFDHVAIVGNSSVVLELLHRGLPVYQYFGTDPIERDYYGFVKSGVTRCIDNDDLTGVFWTPYVADDRWLKNYVRWDPSADTAHVMGAKLFAAEMAGVCGMRAGWSAGVAGPVRRALGYVKRLRTSKPTVKKQAKRDRISPSFREFLSLSLRSATQPSDWLRLNRELRMFSEGEVIRELTDMHSARDAVFGRFLEAAPKSPQKWPLGVWLYLKRSELNNIVIPPEELEWVADFVHGARISRYLRSALERALLTAILTFGEAQQLNSFLESASTISLEGLSVSRQIDVLRKLSRTPGLEEEATRLREQFESRATAFQKLKFENMDALMGAARSWSHAYGEARFVETAPPPLVWEFEELLRPVYDRLRPRMSFMDVRTDPAAASAFLDRVERAVRLKEPFSLIRLSDGEGYLFPDETVFTGDDRRNRERHWWGVELPVELGEEIQRECRAALASADVVGIPSITRFIRDSSENSNSLMDALQGRGLIAVLSGVEDTISDEAILAEDKINVTAFGNVERLSGLISAASKVVVVSSVHASNLPELIRCAPFFDYVTIPTHHKTSLNELYHVASNPLPFVYTTILDEVRSKAEPGTLFLIAGGIVGKIFIGAARERGAVALDLGHVLDDWIAPRLEPLR